MAARLRAAEDEDPPEQLADEEQQELDTVQRKRKALQDWAETEPEEMFSRR